MQFRPMLAVQADIASITYPVLASYKIDGVRALVLNGQLLSRTLKPIPNRALRERFSKPEFEGWDGELALIYPSGIVAEDCYRETVSTVMTEECDSAMVTWSVFDSFRTPTDPYYKRYESVDNFRLHSVVINNVAELAAYEQLALELGYEGLIIRDPDAPYKYGRSTLRQGWMLKVKRFKDDEGRVVDFEELMHNANPAQLDERGYTKHSHHQANKVPMGMLGALVVNWRGQLLRLGTGFTQEERQRVWNNKDRYKGALAKFKYLETGMKDLPRHPVFLGWRSALDRDG